MSDQHLQLLHHPATSLASDAVTQLPVEDLVYEVADATVRTGEPEYGQLLLAELERRSDHALWEAALVCLGLLSSRPVYGLPEEAGVDRLRQIARTTPDAVTALVLELQARHRSIGRQAAHLVWQEAPADIRHTAMLQLLIMLCWSVGSEHGRLTPAQTASLIKNLVITPGAPQ
ncbi:hypothetical protein KV557_00545 [Kitasatospora aureofaciens]|uniref:hypothetical protein n=1 Tax=Kitasatospora aureofaciens TaxID=1894 RepID=UPI001C437F31|nr:hypothetical protein [Kitasatospora aureofaciens]MBV6695614.1 hypothetical protein [Kitasatospora aureofaciens]